MIFIFFIAINNNNNNNNNEQKSILKSQTKTNDAGIIIDHSPSAARARELLSDPPQLSMNVAAKLRSNGMCYVVLFTKFLILFYYYCYSISKIKK